MSPNLRAGGHIDFGADPASVGAGVTLSCLHNLSNQWLDSYQISMDI